MRGFSIFIQFKQRNQIHIVDFMVNETNFSGHEHSAQSKRRSIVELVGAILSTPNICHCFHCSVIRNKEVSIKIHTCFGHKRGILGILCQCVDHYRSQLLLVRVKGHVWRTAVHQFITGSRWSFSPLMCLNKGRNSVLIYFLQIMYTLIRFYACVCDC